MTIVAATLSFVFAMSAAADDTSWPHLRGPAHDGQTTSSVFEAGDFDLEVAWRTALGAGYSSVVAADGHVVTMAQAGDTDFVVALDAETGRERWRAPIGPAYHGHDGSEDGPVSTPLVSKGVVYALGPLGRFVAIDLASGDALWSHDLVEEFGAQKPDYGFTTTPTADEDLIIVQIGGIGGHGLGAFDAETGELRWSTGDEKVGYQSPMIMDLAGQRQLVAFRGPVLSAHDPQTGAELWQYELGRRDQSDTTMPMPVDADHFAAVTRGGLLVFKVTNAEGAFSAEPVVRSRDLGNTFSPPVRFGDHFYGFRGDFLTCVDAKTGKRVWKSRPPGGEGLILVNDRLIVFGALGRVVVVPATPEGYREEASLEVFDRSAFSWPAFADDRILLRTPSEVASIRVVRGERTAQRSATGSSNATTATNMAAPNGAFAQFVHDVEALLDDEARRARVDRYLAEHEQLPIVEGHHVHFIYHGDADDVAIAGSMIDESQPEPLQRLAGTDLFYRTLPIEPASRVEYRFHVDLEEWTVDPRNPNTTPAVRNDHHLSEVVMPGHVSPEHIAEASTPLRGRMETFEFQSIHDNRERSINVYLPPGYDADTSRDYPMLMVHNGQEWMEKAALASAVDGLIASSRIAPVVVVFVDTIGMWWLEAGGTQTDAFVDMLVTQMLPELDRRYRLQDDRSARVVLGTEHDGLSAAYAALKHPGVFGGAAVQSIGLQNGTEDALLELIARRPEPRVRLYVDWNVYEAHNTDRGYDFKNDSQVLTTALEQNGYAYVGGEALDTHGWGSWRSRSDRILEAFFPAENATR